MANSILSSVIQDYQEYLETHNSVETKSKFGVYVEGKPYFINVDMFLNMLVDKVAMTVVFSSKFDNPLSRLYDGEIRFGSTVEVLRTIRGVSEQEYNAKDFESDVANPWAKNKPVVAYEFMKINFRKKLTTTVSTDQILTAFRSDESMTAFINLIINDLGMQRNALEFLFMKNTIQEGIAYKQTFANGDYADFYLKIKNVITNFKDYDNSLYYNKLLNPEPALPNELYIIMSEDFKNEGNVKYLATLFNVDYVELKDQIIYIKNFPDTSLKCVICDKRAIFFKKNLELQPELRNPADLTYNIWLHFWRLFAVSGCFGVVGIYEEPKVAVNKPTVDIGTGVYEGAQTVTITQGTATNVKYTLDSGDEQTVTTSAEVSIGVPSDLAYVHTLTVTYDGGEDVYRYRIFE